MFKKCTSCGFEWQKRDDFLSDPNTKMIGYQVNFKDLELGWFLFNHEICKTTLAIQAMHFADLHHGEVMHENMHGTTSCPTHCLNSRDLGICPVKCECNYVRNIIQDIKSWPKKQLVESVE